MDHFYKKDTENKINSMTRTRRAGSMRSSNGGFSFIEMIIVVTIIAIAAGAAVVTLSSALRASTTRAAAELEAVISEARLETMSRPAGSVELKIYKSDDDGRFYADIVIKDDESERIIETKSIVSGAVTISAADLGSMAEASSVIDENNSAIIKFDKGSGRLKSFQTAAGSGYDSIMISGAKTSTVRIAKNTGRSYIE